MPIETLTPDQSQSLLAALSNFVRYNSPLIATTRNQLIAILMLDAGLRCLEVAALQWDQCMFGKTVLSAIVIPSHHNHTNQDRTIPMTPRLNTAIANWKACPSPPFLSDLTRWVFPSYRTKGHLRVRQIHRIIKSAGKYALNQEVHPHMLRHTFATNLMRTSPTRVVQELLGHKCLTSTQIYTHPNSSDLKDAIATLANPSGPPKPIGEGYIK